MSQPLIFISRHRVAPQHLERVRQLAVSYSEHAASADPNAIVVQFFVDEAQHELVYVQVHPSADATDAHLQLAHERIGAALELVRTSSITVGGEPGPVLSEALRHNREAGAAVDVFPSHLAGFVRLGSRDGAAAT